MAVDIWSDVQHLGAGLALALLTMRVTEFEASDLRVKLRVIANESAAMDREEAAAAAPPPGGQDE